MFNYGTKSSGRTFTTFGPDDPVFPEAWFKWPQPHDLWGIFPRVAYDLFEMCEQTWKFRMKYFQNVADDIRDLMSRKEKSKSSNIGLQKDFAGFLDVSWCTSKKLKNFKELCSTFMKADARKAVAPTQFSRFSPRGHSVLNLVVDKPNADNQELRQQGRIYMCDIARPEPTNSIYYASYKKVETKVGSVDYKLVGPDKNQKLTKDLQEEYKEISISVSEMAQVFRSMAQAIKREKKGKSGLSVKMNARFNVIHLNHYPQHHHCRPHPVTVGKGSASHFLTKYIKHNMFQVLFIMLHMPYPLQVCAQTNDRTRTHT